MKISATWYSGWPVMLAIMRCRSAISAGEISACVPSFWRNTCSQPSWVRI